MIRVTTRARAVVTGIAVAALLVSGCTGTGPAPTSSPSTSAAQPPTTPPPMLPTDCEQLGTPETRADLLDGLTFQGGDYSEFVRPAPSSAQLVLGCDWFGGDATGLLVLISTASPSDVADAAAALPDEGFTCAADDAGGQVCELVTPHPDFPVDGVETVVARDGVWVYLQTSNLDGTPLLDEIVQGIFG